MISEDKTRVKNVWMRASTVIVSLFIFLIAVQGNTGEVAPVEQLDPLEGLLSEEAWVRDQAVLSLLQGHGQTVADLITLVDPNNANKYSDQTRSVAAYLLGEFRAVKSVRVLSLALADPPGRRIIVDISPYDVPIETALFKIGRPAVPAMIENIERSDNKLLRRRSLGVLNHVLGGKRRVLELLTKLKARAKKDKDEKRIERIEAALKYVEKHYKEKKEPLY